MITATGAAPKTHDTVISAFGRLVKDGSDPAKAAGRAINAAFDTRCSAHYDTGYELDAETARETFEAAEKFLRVCQDLIAAATEEAPPTDIP